MRTLGRLSALATLGLALYSAGFFLQFTTTASPGAVAVPVTLFLGLASISALTVFALFVEAPNIEVLAIALNGVVAVPALGIFVTFLAILLADASPDWAISAVVLEPCLIFGGLHACNAFVLANSFLFRLAGKDVLTLLREAVSRSRGSTVRPESRRISTETRAMPRRSEPVVTARGSASAARPATAPRPLPARIEPRPLPARSEPRPPLLNVRESVLGFRWLMRLAGAASLVGLVWFMAHDRLLGFSPAPVSESRPNAGPLACEDLPVRGWRALPEDDPNSFLLEVTLQPKEKRTLRLESVSLFGPGERGFSRGTPLEPAGRAPNSAGDLTLTARFNSVSLMGDQVVLVGLTTCAGPDFRACQRLYYGQIRGERGPGCEMPPATDVPEFMAKLGR